MKQGYFRLEKLIPKPLWKTTFRIIIQSNDRSVELGVTSCCATEYRQKALQSSVVGYIISSDFLKENENEKEKSRNYYIPFCEELRRCTSVLCVANIFVPERIWSHSFWFCQWKAAKEQWCCKAWMLSQNCGCKYLSVTVCTQHPKKTY